MEQFDVRRELIMAITGGKVYTYADILALPEGERAELIDGELFMMATPNKGHQLSITWFTVQIYNYIQNRKGKCKVLPAPFGVFPKKDNKNYVEPDVSVICDHDRLDDSGCNGVPEWVIEVVSPSSRKMDYERKLKLYRESGVDEYWIVDPMEESVSVYRFAEGEQPERYTFSDVIKSGIFKELEINLKGLQEYIL